METYDQAHADFNWQIPDNLTSVLTLLTDGPKIQKSLHWLQ